MKLGYCAAWVLILAGCQPAVHKETPQAPQPPASEPVAASPDVSRVVIGQIAFPEPTGPVANYFRAEMPVSFQGRWAPDPISCEHGVRAVTIEAKTIASAAVLVRLGDIEVNESRGVILDITAAGNFSAGGKRTDGRANMKLSVEGSLLQVTVMGLDGNGGLPGQLFRCS